MQVREHFSNLYNLREPDWTYRSHWKRCFFGRKVWQRRRFLAPSEVKAAASAAARVGTSNVRRVRDEDVYPVLDAHNTGQKAYLRSWVAEVSIASPNGTLIKRYQAQTGLLQRVRNARAVVKKYNTGSDYADEKKKARALRQLDKIQKQVDVINKKYSSEYKNECVGAFVVFQNEESVSRCVQDYMGSTHWWSFNHYWFQAPQLRFRKGQYRLQVEEAPDPSSIVWQNLELSSMNRCLRQTGVNIMLAALLIGSFICIILSQAQQSKFRDNVPSLQLCNTVLPAIAFNAPFSPAGELATGAHLPDDLTLLYDGSDPVCSPIGRPRLHWYAPGGEAYITSRLNSNPCLDECVSMTASCTWPTTQANTNVTFSMSSVSACYCLRKISTVISQKGIFAGLRSLIESDGSMCGSVARDYVTYNAFVLVASAIVVIINIFLRSLLKFIAGFEGHRFVSGMQRAVAWKVFLSLFLNTACLALIINAALPGSAAELEVAGTRLFSGRYSGFDVRWHVSVGAGIVLTMLINIVTPHMFSIMRFLCVMPCRRLTGDKRAVTQVDLNSRFTPPNFEMPTRTAVVMNTFFSCLMYSAGHPILLPIAAAAFIVSYVVDKYAILRMYRRPPMFDHAMADFAVSLMPWGVMIHLAVAIWMYSDPNVMYSPSVFAASSDASAIVGSDISSTLGGLFASAESSDASGLGFSTRLQRVNTLPLFALFLLIPFVWFVYS
ncbi:hypothetical protein EON62_01075, partial [archaeon]